MKRVVELVTVTWFRRKFLAAREYVGEDTFQHALDPTLWVDVVEIGCPD